MCINYHIDYNDNIIKILTNSGYNVEGNYIHSYSSNKSDVYLLSNRLYAKYYNNLSSIYSWNEMKNHLLELSSLNLIPDIKEIINISEVSGIIISYEFGIPYSRFTNNETVDKLVIDAIINLHSNGYLHGDIHKDNILVDENQGSVRFVDVDTCFHTENPNLDKFLIEYYDTSSIEEARSIELMNANLKI